MWSPSEAWRDSYDAWKLATPPEYECQEGDEWEPEFEPIDIDDDYFELGWVD